ncbi:MAG: HD domain-containing protein [Spirochaetaceae bacterium]|jgi:uncharacterized protein|nr:HD domain-containing protein [Spirochaetaceae bacterium]
MNDLFNEYARDILEHELFLLGKRTISHGAVSIYAHSVNVAKTAFSFCKKCEEREKNRKGPGIDARCVVRAGLLHDFFLYEWHTPGIRYLLHGWAHPKAAAENARAVFNLSDKECSCIRTHMWPWTLFHPPRCREGWIISLADKLVAGKETFLHRPLRGF